MTSWKHKEWLTRQNYVILAKRDNPTPLEFGVKNCYTWAKEQITSHGGRWTLAWSENWFGHFHVIYVEKDGSLWGYGPDDESYISLFRFIIDREWTFSGHTTEYETYTSFMDGLREKIWRGIQSLASIFFASIALLCRTVSRCALRLK